jgi:hypothetical protein
MDGGAELQIEAISQIASIGLNALAIIWIGQHWATTREKVARVLCWREAGAA